ncbi:MAG: Fic family protein, partial [Pseudomonadales bacterium]
MTKIVTIQLEEILKILERYPEGLSLGEIASHLSFSLNNKTLQRRLLALLNAKKIRKEGERRGTKYFPLETNVRENEDEDKDIPHEIFSNESLDVLKFLDAPMHTRERMSYKREFLENYAPNETIYVPIDLREQLKKEGKRVNEKLAAGTYAKQISQRLLIDLSYNSSRLEGNTYSKLDTQRLIEDGITAEDKVHEETVMIMNHKEALTFLVENAEDIELNAFTIFNLHYLLSQDLLKNPESCGNIRKIEVD